MIDRKTLWSSGAILFAMISAALWRLTLLADWTHMPLDGARSTQHVNGLFLFILPSCLLIAMSLLYVQRWLNSDQADDAKSWRRFATDILLPYSLICGAFELVIIAHSLGVVGALDRETIARFFGALIGGLLVVLGNKMPKLPPRISRIAFLRFEPWQAARRQRFQGKITVFFGIAFIGVQLLPAQVLPAMPRLLAMTSLMLFYFTATIWFFIKLRRETVR